MAEVDKNDIVPVCLFSLTEIFAEKFARHQSLRKNAQKNKFWTFPTRMKHNKWPKNRIRYVQKAPL